jgi:hypothetical protein
MIRNRVAPGGASNQQAPCASTQSGTGGSHRGSHQKIEPTTDDTDTGPTARTDMGELLKCILNSHG